MTDHQYQVNHETLKKQVQKSDAVQQNSEHDDLLALQSVVGNQSMQKILAKPDNQAPTQPSLFIQAKLSVGPADDKYEEEADNVASKVMRMSDPVQRVEEEELMQGKRLDIQRQEEEELQAKPDFLQRQPMEEEEEELQPKRLDIQRQEEEELQAKPDFLQRQPMEEEEEELQPKRLDIQRAGAGDGFDVGGDVEENIRSMKGSGQPLPDETRGFFESRMGRDFSGVKIHDNSQSDSLNQSIQARAFTTGSDIFLKQGEYNPSSSGGKELLAHELTHVVQQGNADIKKETEDK
jgi:hypothetical protein